MSSEDKALGGIHTFSVLLQSPVSSLQSPGDLSHGASCLPRPVIDIQAEFSRPGLRGEWDLVEPKEMSNMEDPPSYYPRTLVKSWIIAGCVSERSRDQGASIESFEMQCDGREMASDLVGGGSGALEV